MFGHSQDCHPIVNVALSLIFSMSFFCKKRGFVSSRHNHIRNIMSILLKEVCKDVRVELQLQQLTGEYLQHSTTAGNEVRLDISICGFWKAGQIAFLDVRVSNPNVKWYANIELAKSYEVNEKEKKKYITNIFFRSSMEVSHLSARGWTQEILLTASRNDFQEKKIQL